MQVYVITRPSAETPLFTASLPLATRNILNSIAAKYSITRTGAGLTNTVVNDSNYIARENEIAATLPTFMADRAAYESTHGITRELRNIA
jgi:hypothetical protein